MASYSVLIMCCLLPWCVSSPAQCGCRWRFYCCGHRARLFPGSAICPPRGTFHALLKGSAVWAHVCGLAQVSQPPGEAPGIRQSVTTPLGKEVNVVAPVPCPVRCPGARSRAAQSVGPERQCPPFTGLLTHTFLPHSLSICSVSLSLIPEELKL